jgi:predicted GIY-YIG superfamily endonuclease
MKPETKTKLNYVYVLRNTTTDKIEYVGVSVEPDIRFKLHTRRKPGPLHRHGKFYKRTDIKMQIVGAHPNRNQALMMERHIKLAEGIEPTEQTRGNILNESVCVKVYDENNNLIGEYPSVRWATKELKLNRKAVYDRFHNGIAIYKNYKIEKQ